MSTRARSLDIDLGKVAYAPVGDILDSQIEEETKIFDGSEVPDLFKYYVEEIGTKGDISRVTFGRFGPDSTVEGSLTTLLNDPNDGEFKSETASLAKKLNDQMPASANNGVLFVAFSEVDGGNVADGPRETVSLLKLDTERDQRIILSEDGIGAVDEDNAFPPRDQLQKGAIYPKEGLRPHEISGDIKIFQNTDSDYFERFFELRSSLPSSIEQGRKALSFVESKVSQSLGRELNSGDISTVNEYSEQNSGVIDEQTLAQAASDITDSEISEDEVTDALRAEQIPELNFNAQRLPQVFKHSLFGSGGEITVKYNASADDRVHFEHDEDSDTYVIRVEGGEHNVDRVER